MGECSLPMSFSCFQNISSFLRGNYLSPSGCTSKQTVYFLILSSDSLWQGCSGLTVCTLSAHSEGQPEWWHMCHQPQEVLLARWCCHVDAICLFIWWHLFTQCESGKKIPFPVEWEITESSRVLVPASRWCCICSEFMVYLVKVFNNSYCRSLYNHPDNTVFSRYCVGTTFANQFKSQRNQVLWLIVSCKQKNTHVLFQLLLFLKYLIPVFVFIRVFLLY